MIIEDYVSFEVAKLLKEKGFNKECLGTYSTDNKELNISSECPYSNDLNDDMFIAAPTLQMAMKWLRRLYWLNMYPKYSKWSNKWSIVILSLDDREIIKGNTAIQIDGFVSYEEAVNEGIKYCLTNLI